MECIVQNLVVEQPNTTVECSNPPNNLSMVHTFKFGNETSLIKVFPVIAEKYTEIRHIHINNAKLTQITQNDLQRYPKLYQLNVEGNEIESLDDGLFDFNPNLHIINLNKNKIKFIQGKVFNNLTNLKTLQLSNNICINEGFSENYAQVKLLIDAAKFRCAKHDDNPDCSEAKKEVENLKSSVKFSLIFNVVQVLIMFVAIGGFLMIFLRKKKEIATKQVTIHNEYHTPNDVQGSGDNNQYAEPYGTPSRPATIQKSK